MEIKDIAVEVAALEEVRGGARRRWTGGDILSPRASLRQEQVGHYVSSDNTFKIGGQVANSPFTVYADTYAVGDQVLKGSVSSSVKVLGSQLDI